MSWSTTCIQVSKSSPSCVLFCKWRPTMRPTRHNYPLTWSIYTHTHRDHGFGSPKNTQLIGKCSHMKKSQGRYNLNTSQWVMLMVHRSAENLWSDEGGKQLTQFSVNSIWQVKPWYVYNVKEYIVTLDDKW